MTRTNKILLAVALAGAAFGALWFFALAPKREEAAKLDAAIAAKQSEVATAKDTIAGYRKARNNYRSNYATLVRLGKAVPEDDDVRSLLVQLDAAAGGTGVDFRSVTVGGGSSGAAPTTTASPAAAGTTAAGTAAAGTAAADGPPPGAVSIGAAGFSAMPFSFSFKGDFENLSRFFTRLERFVTLRNEQMNVTGRLLRLESIDLQVDQDGFPAIRAQIGASSYLVPATEGITAGATPQGPATGATPAATPAPSGGPAAPTTTSTVTGATP